MTIKIESQGRRHYLIGDTYPIRAAVKAAGCKWDAGRRAWWTGKLETAVSLADKVKSGGVTVECSWRKVGNDFLVAVPTGLNAKPGDMVTVRKASGDAKQVTLGAEVQPGLFDVAKEPRKRAEREPRPSLKLVGEQTDLVSDFDGSKNNREPHRAVGDCCWLNLHFGGARRPLACVVVGYKPAAYYQADEDNGDYSEFRGYRGYLYYRPATREEHGALQAKTPRDTAITPEEWASK